MPAFVRLRLTARGSAACGLAQGGLRSAMKAILWDNDGVLVDTEPFYFEASRAALRPLGVEFDEAIYIDWSLRQGGSCFELARAQGVSEASIGAARAARDA